MGLAGLFGPIFKQVLGNTGASQPSATIQRTEVEQKPATALEQVNAAVITPPEQLRATANSMSQATTPEIIQNPEAPLAINQQETKPSAIKLEVSQEALNSFKPILSKAINTLHEMLPFIAAEIKAFLPKSPFDEIFSESIKKNGGTKAAQQWLETRLKNNPKANTQAATAPNPA